MSPTPARSGKSARPVPGRTRDTDHRQRSCRAASAGAVKREAQRHLCYPPNKTQKQPKTHHNKPKNNTNNH
ncbi:arginase [Escherichia coli]|uniref:arginase n=1 Tax=Escherichia coli TaxID=562 RepID=UPI0040640F66